MRMSAVRLDGGPTSLSCFPLLATAPDCRRLAVAETHGTRRIKKQWKHEIGNQKLGRSQIYLGFQDPTLYSGLLTDAISSHQMIASGGVLPKPKPSLHCLSQTLGKNQPQVRCAPMNTGEQSQHPHRHTQPRDVME
jgi:hypothetical protein